jgi:hypothetical protein
MNWEGFKSRSDLPNDVEPGEADFLDAFDRWIHHAHPNPERKGCPGKPALMALALTKEKFEDEYILTHIGLCAACLDDLKEIRRELAAGRFFPLKDVSGKPS